MNKRLAVSVIFCLTVICGCSSSNGGGGVSIVQPVQAQTGYSNASLSGTYAFARDADIGTFTADGNGHITSGSMTSYDNYSSPACTGTITGTYSVQSSGAGTLTWAITPGSTCANNGASIESAFENLTPSFNIEVAQQGSAVVAAEIPNPPPFRSGFVASKQ